MITHHCSIHHVVMESNITYINYEHYIANVQNQRIIFFVLLQPSFYF
jgi:hypothetical protein